MCIQRSRILRDSSIDTYSEQGKRCGSEPPSTTVERSVGCLKMVDIMDLTLDSETSALLLPRNPRLLSFPPQFFSGSH